MNIQARLQEINFDSVGQFVAYCDTHAQTPRALFTKHQVALMVELAGNPKTWNTPHIIRHNIIQSYGLHQEMRDFVKRYQDITNGLQKAVSYKELFEIAMTIISATYQPLGMVSGPISTGGLGSIPLNIAAMERHIMQLQETGQYIFDQTPFEDAMQRIKGTSKGYAQDLLDEFYLPIFESGYIKKLFLMKGWQDSTGAKWEHVQAQRLGIQILYQE